MALAEGGQYLMSSAADLSRDLVLMTDCENICVRPGSGDLDAGTDMDLNTSCFAVQPLVKARLFAVAGIAAIHQPPEEVRIGDLLAGATSGSAVTEVVNPLM